MHRIDELVERLSKAFEGKEEVVFNGGLSVSGLQHVGRLRGEVILNDVLARELRKRGFKTKQYITLYTMDARKGKKAQVEKLNASYTGRPLISVPDPYGCHENRVEHYRSDFGPYIERFVSGEVEVVRTDEMYKEMKEIIEAFIEKKEIVREIINKYRKRKPFPSGRIPFNPRCENCGRIDKAEAIGYSDGEFEYLCKHCGHRGKVPYYRGKLNRRLERVAVRKFLSVDFEPYGKDHAAPGGSRDSCNELAKALGINPPLGERYERVAIREGKRERDMSSSSFIGFTPRDRLEVARPEVLRYLFLRTHPHKKIVLSLEEVPRYYELFYEAEREFYEHRDSYEARSYELSLLEAPRERIPVQVPYTRIAILVQTLPKENRLEAAIKRLKKAGLIEEIDEYDVKRIASLLNLAENRVKKYAPERLRFEVLENTPKVEMSEERELIERILERLEKLTERSSEAILEAMKEVNEGVEKKLLRKEFETLYKLFLGKTSGPRIAYLFSSLEKEFVLRRLKEGIMMNRSTSE